MVAVPLIHGRLTTEDYSDTIAQDPRIDSLRAKMQCVEDKVFSTEYHDPEKRSIGNAIKIQLNDGTWLDEVMVEYPVGHKRRRKEGEPLLINKFKRHVQPHYSQEIQKKIFDISLSRESFEKMPVSDYLDIFFKG